MKLSHRILAAGLVTIVAMVPIDSFALQWESIGPEGGRIDGLVQAPSNPNRMYVLPYRQGVWRSENRGANWIRVDTGLPLDQTYEAIAVSSSNEDFVIIAPQQSSSARRSTDGGVTWSSSLVPNGIGTICDISFDPLNSQNVLLTTSDGTPSGRVCRSTDAGASWVTSGTGLGSAIPSQLAYHPAVPGIVLLAADAGVFRSTDGGVNWTPSNTNGNGTVGSISICKTVPSQAWSLGYPDGFMRSTDSGVSFQPIGIPAGCGPFNCGITDVAVDPSDPARILGGFAEIVCGGSCNWSVYVRKSTDAGSTWSDLSFPNGDLTDNQAISSLFFDASSSNETYFSVGQVEGNAFPIGLVRSTDGGVVWNPWMNGLTGLNILNVDSGAAGRIFARGSMVSGLWSADFPGDAWVDHSSSMPDDFSPTVFETNPAIPGMLYEAGVSFSMDTMDPHFRRSTDFGATWVSASFPQEGLFVSPEVIVADNLDGETIYVWSDAENPYLCRSTDDSPFVFFEVVHEGFLAAGAVVDPTDPYRVFAIRRDAPGDVQLSTDGGVTWTSRSNGLPSSQAVTILRGPAIPGHADHLAAVYRTAGVFGTTNGGLSWVAVALPGYSSQPVIDADWDPASDRFFLATQSNGVYVSGAGFVSDGLTTGKFTSICYEPLSQNVLLGTEHASVLRLNVGGAVDVATIDLSPSDLAIQVRPNPSPEEFHFEVNLPHATSRAALAIFDVRGRRIATPFAGKLPRGKQVIDWAGRMSSGERTVPGVYFARLEADGRTATTRITLIGGESK